MNPHTLRNDNSLNIMDAEFSKLRPNINYTITSYPLGNKTAFSITLSNLSEPDDNSLVTCEVMNSFSTVHPVHPFVLLIKSKYVQSALAKMML